MDDVRPQARLGHGLFVALHNRRAGDNCARANHRVGMMELLNNPDAVLCFGGLLIVLLVALGMVVVAIWRTLRSPEKVEDDSGFHGREE